MQQRQLRLGDVLDDYCPRERRVTNHAIVAMVGEDVKQTRCTTCDTEHQYKHAKIPRQRKKADAPAALYAQVAAAAPKRVQHEPRSPADSASEAPKAAGPVVERAEPSAEPLLAASDSEPDGGVAETASQALDIAASEQIEVEIEVREELEEEGDATDVEEGPVHRPLIRATLPRPEGQMPPARPLPEFTIRQPGGRPNRFRPRSFHGGPFEGNRPNGNMGGPPRGGAPRWTGGGRPPEGAMTPRTGRRRGRKRSK